MITAKSCKTAILRIISGAYHADYDLNDEEFEAVVDLCDEYKSIIRYTTPAKEDKSND